MILDISSKFINHIPFLRKLLEDVFHQNEGVNQDIRHGIQGFFKKAKGKPRVMVTENPGQSYSMSPEKKQHRLELGTKSSRRNVSRERL